MSKLTYRAIMKIDKAEDVMGSWSKWTSKTELHSKSRKGIKRKIKEFKRYNKGSWVSELIQYRDVEL